MPFWANKKDSQPEQKPRQSTTSWANTNDESGFLHPESSLASNRDLVESAWSKERSNQQLDLEDVHDEQLGCCSKVGMFTVKTLHAIDLCLGLSLVIYGSLLLTQFETPAKAAALFSLILGTIHLASSLAGIFSFVVGSCYRYGLLISAYISPYFVLVYISIVISLVVDSAGFLKYIDDHKDQMFFGQDAAANFKRMLPLFYTILSVLGTLESMRFLVLFQIRERLLRRDYDVPLKPRSTRSTGPNETLTEALLEGNTDADGSLETGGMGKGHGEQKWWES
mmetsp:Transcript_19003/g.27060  ORF Transcript_19003/g.27060 Transcript_19003/m.27060 type:complete len:281 (+) Transcript_19003:227-1069(+)|eukprot:CAMPEP_0201709488 /NCGR_PEP_ID=MMETSP0578-20130828/58128_1 /ASSEMBLY_ACC=CAM_ASM_000663 /TAXON_ID=267565 /ORGANISM="Skeletonema grethea, Strain CCMP 1804" /LENGTH=280 /DNA_ID=CAMNT_0048198465 /DNA_START=211 /DNA_END=1053 /DNA_ORIENTATION=-